MSKRKSAGVESNVNSVIGQNEEQQDAGCISYLYNPRKGTILDRSGAQWGEFNQITFYLIKLIISCAYQQINKINQ